MLNKKLALTGKSVPFFENCTALASTITIVMISCERYRGICQPVKTRTTKVLSRSQIGILIAVSWMSAIVACLPFFFIPIYKDSKFKDGTPIKVCRNTIKETWQIGYIIFVLCFFFILPFLALLIMYIIIAKNLSNDATLQSHQNILVAKVRLKKRRQVVVMLTLVVFSFFVFHLPIRTISLWVVYATRENMIALGLEGYYNLLTFARVLFYLHCATNPIIYNAMSTKFRLATVKVFCTKKSYKKGPPLITKQFSSSLPSRESNQGITSSDKNFPEAETTV
ncbi:growth hormone secretagogue receptor type 1-like [Lingula anatina]|uniref:Growth hormone secretagogue receptor type 1-like n=1 Tax=Lingula anatina TaxID=7574 RepID=A0A2R2MSU2_LINAN|nr:growth hormone secretagogue receptor type 1-like [Lingula anatina]|eukprot:XP_023933193.1 growth hormone secretagogue receptor type 1-like [Lingula anatina]